MLQVYKQRAVEDYQGRGATEEYGESYGDAASPMVMLESLIGIVRRQFLIVILVTALAVTAGILYLYLTPPTFTAEATLLIDRARSPLVQQQQFYQDAPIDAAEIESEIEVLKSDKVARAAITKLHLADGLQVEKPTGISKILAFISQIHLHHYQISSGDSDDGISPGLVFAFESGLDARRVGSSFLIAVTYKSNSPERAAQIANAVVDAYINYQLQEKFDASQRASAWLRGRLSDLEAQSAAADRAAADFRTKHNIVDTGIAKSLNEQQAAELNKSLLDATAQVTTAQARLDRIEGILNQQAKFNDAITGGGVSDALTSPIITPLRAKYLELMNREANWSKRLGPDHLAVVNLRTQMSEIRSSIFDELRRIAETYKSDLAIAKQREASIQKALSGTVAQSTQENGLQSTLADLETVAKARRALYADLERQYAQALPADTFVLSSARSVTPASPPINKSSPKSLKILAIAAFGGLMIGGGIGMLRELLDRVFRTSGQVEHTLQTSCLALVPAVKGEQTRANSPRQASSGDIVPSGSVIRYVSEAPFSRFAESVRALKLAVDLNRIDQSHSVVGFTSAIPNEGKTTIAANLARLIAQSGSRVILVDLDFRNPSLSRSLTPNVSCGLLEVLAGRSSMENALRQDPMTGLAFLPAFVPARISNSSEILCSPHTSRLFENLRQNFDHVVVDLPPLAPIVDVRATARLMDTYVLVIEWGRTKIPVVERALADAPVVSNNLLGVVLNKADMSTVRQYDGHVRDYYDNKDFSRYGYID